MCNRYKGADHDTREMQPIVCQGKKDLSQKNVCHVTFAENTVIHKSCQMYLHVSLSQQKHCSRALEPTCRLMEQHGFLIACLICSLETRTTVVRVLNPSPAPVYSNQQVGTLQPFNEPSASALQLSENCNKINPGAEEAVQQMMAQVEDLSTSERERLHSLIRYFGKMQSSTKLILEMLHQSASLH